MVIEAGICYTVFAVEKTLGFELVNVGGETKNGASIGAGGAFVFWSRCA